jgi:hypothetical protein
MDQPTSFEDGFDYQTIIGGVFLGLVMMPGAIYLGLLAGQTIGAAAEWTTVILFTEIARRSFMTLTRQEVYILFYVASALTAMSGQQLAGGILAGKMWDQYLVQSTAAKGFGIADEIPRWVVPSPYSDAIQRRTFFHHDWWFADPIGPIPLLLLGTILSRLNWFGAGYILFRVTSDVEKLPFPFAAIQAQGATALAESTTKSETWRWRTFSIGAMIGLVFGFFYVGIPALTGAIMAKPLQLIPIPWIDLTRNTEDFLPATATGIVPNLGSVFGGFVVPFWAVVGGFIMAMTTFFVNPTLFRLGYLHSWKKGMDTINTQFANYVDFYFSLGIGVAVAIAVLGFYTLGKSYAAAKRERDAAGVGATASWAAPPGRGDFSLWIAGALFVGTTIVYIWLCHWLVPNFPIYFPLIFGFIMTPINSYVDARMQGLIGRWAGIPYAREAAFFLSGAKGVNIWFMPLPNFEHGGRAQFFRVVELTGTKITSIVKAELLILPIITVCSFIFWQFIWRLAPVPSYAYPYANKMWHLGALGQCLWLSSTSENNVFFKEAVKPGIMVFGFIFAISAYTILSSFRLPILLVYGVAQGLGAIPHGAFPEMAGALLSRYYFEKRFGQRTWKQYATVLSAGYACGNGLIGMGSCAIAMIAKSVSQLPY